MIAGDQFAGVSAVAGNDRQAGRPTGTTMLISVHIPKTAGTTFRELLADYFGDDLCLFYGGWRDRHLAAISQPPPSLRCIHGHFHARDFEVPFPDGRRIVWLRDPVERVCSEYEHHCRHRDPQNSLSTLVGAGTGLLEFAEHPEARNTQTRVLQGLAIEDFAFVGISERFDAELVRLRAATGIGLPSGHHVNANPARRTVRYPLAADQYRTVLRLNREDHELYLAAMNAAACRVGDRTSRVFAGGSPVRGAAQAVA